VLQFPVLPAYPAASASRGTGLAGSPVLRVPALLHRPAVVHLAFCLTGESQHFRLSKNCACTCFLVCGPTHKL